MFFDWSLRPTQKNMQTLYHVVGNRINYTWHCPPMCLKGWLPFFRAHALQRRCATTVGDRDYQVDCVKQPKIWHTLNWKAKTSSIFFRQYWLSVMFSTSKQKYIWTYYETWVLSYCWDGHHASHAFPPLRPTRIPLEGLNLRARWKLHHLHMEKQWEFDLNWMCQAKNLRLNISKMYRIHMLPNFFWKMEFSCLEGLFCHWNLSPHSGFKIAAVFFWVSCLSLFFPCLSRHLKIETEQTNPRPGSLVCHLNPVIMSAVPWPGGLQVLTLECGQWTPIFGQRPWFVGPKRARL